MLLGRKDPLDRSQNGPLWRLLRDLGSSARDRRNPLQGKNSSVSCFEWYLRRGDL